MKQVVYFEVVEKHTGSEWWQRFSTEEEARQAVEEEKQFGQYFPSYIRKTTCKLNNKGKTVHKIVKNMGLA